MRVTVTLSDLLKKASGQYDPVSIASETLEDCIKELAFQFPVLHKWLYEDTGKIKPHVWLLVNDERIYQDAYTRPLQDGDNISVTVAVLGG